MENGRDICAYTLGLNNAHNDIWMRCTYYTWNISIVAISSQIHGTSDEQLEHDLLFCARTKIVHNTGNDEDAIDTQDHLGGKSCG